MKPTHLRLFTAPFDGWEVRKRLQICLLIVLFVGVLVRTFDFPGNPPGLNQDEASIGYDAYALLKFGVDRNGYSFPVHFVSWGSGQNSLYAYLMMPFISLLGLTPLTVRLPNLIMGLLSLVYFHRFCRRFHSEEFSLVAVAFLAINPWHILISRWGLESNILPAFVLFGATALANPTRNRLMVAAVCFALAFYAYGTAYFFVPCFLMGTIPWFLMNKAGPRRIIVPACIFLALSLPIFAFVIINHSALPEIRTHWISVPKLVVSRFDQVSLFFSEDWFQLLLGHITRLAGFLVTQSDNQPWNAIPGFGVIYLVTLPFVMVGAGHACVAGRKNGGDLIMLIWLGCGILLGLTIEININRMNVLFLPLIYFSARGICYCCFLLPSARFVIGVLYLALFCFFSKAYFTTYRREMSGEFNDGFGPAIRFAIKADAGRIQVVTRANMPYIHVLFWTRVSPQDFMHTVSYADSNATFRSVNSFGRFEFMDANSQGETGITQIVDRDMVGNNFDKNCVVSHFNRFSVIVWNQPSSERIGKGF